MNRRSFLSAVPLGAATLALPASASPKPLSTTIFDNQRLGWEPHGLQLRPWFMAIESHCIPVDYVTVHEDSWEWLRTGADHADIHMGARAGAPPSAVGHIWGADICLNNSNFPRRVSVISMPFYPVTYLHNGASMAYSRPKMWGLRFMVANEYGYQTHSVKEATAKRDEAMRRGREFPYIALQGLHFSAIHPETAS